MFWHQTISGICIIQWLVIHNWSRHLQPTTSHEFGGGRLWDGLKRMSKRVRFRTDLICLCPKHCAKAFERSLEPWSMRRAVWREIGNENIKKRLRKIMFRIHVTDSINQIFDDEMVYITKTNPITKKQKCNRFISYNWARVLRRRNAYILELVNDVCSFFFDREINLRKFILSGKL